MRGNHRGGRRAGWFRFLSNRALKTARPTFWPSGHSGTSQQTVASKYELGWLFTVFCVTEGRDDGSGGPALETPSFCC